ncbi:MAG: polymer-forming cytoskeletal protein [Patescibacteria group bacterium]|jgi:cytoskeletal protein CcmA (bactofilin family)
MKKTTLLAGLVLLFLPFTVSAYSIKTDDSVYVPKSETIEGNLYAAGANVTIEGKVTGDVFCAGQAINISGEVAGDVICAGQSISVSGNVGGSLRAVGNSINLSGKVSRNVMAFGASILSSASSSVGWDMMTFGAFGQIAGNVGRDLYGGLGQASLSGQIGKNVNLNFGQQNKKSDKPALILTGTAVIGGDVKYTSNQEATIENGAVVKGEVIHNFPKITAKKSGANGIGWWWGKIISLFSALVLGLVLISFWREQIIKITDLMLKKVGPSLGWGVLALLLTPIAAIILLITIIGIPLSLILMALWLIAMYVSKILAGILIGRSFLSNYWLKQKDSLILAMIIGIIIAYLIFALPIIGSFVALLAVLWGLGGILLALKNK